MQPPVPLLGCPRPSWGDPVAGSGWCCSWACAVPAALAQGAAGFWGGPKAAGHSWGGMMGWGRRDPWAGTYAAAEVYWDPSGPPDPCSIP